MSVINILPPHVADMIAAGEVVERPASVIKELIENSVDAGARNITVEIQNGGMGLIRVSDDGCGMSPEDAGVAFLRHATSKLHDERGLESISTLGFRGEALAAISAVSRIELLTRQRGDDTGTHVALTAGDIQEMGPAGCPEGTRMSIKDLFFNTPARLKFMKSDKAEGSACTAMALRCALGHPEVSVRMIKDGQEQFFSPGDGQIKSAVYSLLGRDTANGMLECSGENDGVTVKGYISAPHAGRGNRAMQFFFINGRPFRSQAIQAALEQAYRNTLLTGRFPGCALYIELSPGKVDVNVHPAKTEVKFSDEKKVFDAVYYACVSALNGQRNTAEIKLSSGTEKALGSKAPVPGGAKSGLPEMRTTQGVQMRMAPPVRYDTLPKLQGEIAELHDDGLDNVIPLPGGEKMRLIPPGYTGETGSQPQAGAYTKAQSILPGRSGDAAFFAGERPASTALRREESFAGSAREGRPGMPTQRQAPPYVTASAGSEHAEAIAPTIADAAADSKASAEAKASESPVPCIRGGMVPDTDGEPCFRVIGEAMNTYIIVETQQELLLIDKHAAHERMIFDRLKEQGMQVMSQSLMVPVVYSPGADTVELVEENRQLLDSAGFEMEPYGHDSVIIRAVPADTDGDVTAMAEEICEDLKRGSAGERRDAVLHTIACKAAIKAGWHTDEKERLVIAEKVVSGQVRYCPHGRPVSVALSRRELDKQFKRIV